MGKIEQFVPPAKKMFHIKKSKKNDITCHEHGGYWHHTIHFALGSGYGYW